MLWILLLLVSCMTQSLQAERPQNLNYIEQEINKLLDIQRRMHELGYEPKLLLTVRFSYNEIECCKDAICTTQSIQPLLDLWLHTPRIAEQPYLVEFLRLILFVYRDYIRSACESLNLDAEKVLANLEIALNAISTFSDLSAKISDAYLILEDLLAQIETVDNPPISKFGRKLIIGGALIVLIICVLHGASSQ